MDLWSRIQELGTADFAYARGVYEEEVRGQDAAVGELLAVLDGMGLLEDTVVVLLADHGEEFYEHERFTHAGRMWEEQIHVPLVLSIPAWLRSDLVPPPQRFAAPVSQADFLPTILEVLGIPDAAPRQGRSFLDVLRGTRREEGLVYSFENERLGALRAGPLKLIWNDPADAAPGETAPELYHLGRDPGEKQNIAADHPGPVAELLARRRQLEEELRVRGGLPPQPSDVQFGEAEVEALRALGYLEEEPPPE
jgi:arylsulfatase A-like enzyme